jgi:hypothetical protein
MVMKKIVTILAFFFFSYGFSQTGINYQAIIKNSSGNVYSNSTMVVTFSLRYDTSGGSVIYSETHNATSTSEGQISLVVGTGNKTSNGVNFSAIDFSKLIFYTTQVNIGGAGNVSLGTQQLRSVSSAYFAKNAAGISADANNNIVIGTAMSNNVSGTSGVAIGVNALQANTTGDQNHAVGYNALSANTTGIENVAFGYAALSANTSGEFNVGLGNHALQTNTTGDNNTAIGYAASEKNTTGDNNSAFGIRALRFNTTGVLNTAIGSRAMRVNVTGSSNTALGNEALTLNTTGSENTALGVSALTANTTGTQNVAVGKDALYSNYGNGSTAVGYKSLYSSVGNGPLTAIGFNALRSTVTGTYGITAVGYNSMYSNTTGWNSTALGFQSLYSNTTGADNVSLGTNNLTDNTTGSANTSIGSFALYENTVGYDNTSLGYVTLKNNVLGDNNTAVGSRAGEDLNTDSNNNTFIGSGADTSAGTTINNSTALGANAQITQSNTIQLGNTSVTSVQTSGVVSATGVQTTGTVTATSFVGDGSLLSNLPSSGANNQIWISHALFERTGSQNIASKTGVFNGYYYEFLNLKKGSSGISQTRATFVPPSHWGNGNYKVTLYFLTENANSGNIQVDWGIQVLTMSGNNVSAGNDFIGNSDGAFQYGTTIGAPPSNLTAAAQTANNKRPLQKYTYTYNYNFSGIDFATLHMSRYLNTGYSYSDTYDGDFYVVGIKIEKNY